MRRLLGYSVATIVTARAHRRSGREPVGDCRIAQHQAQLALHAPLTRRRDSPRKLICSGESAAAASRAREARRSRQPEAIGDEVEVVAHAQIAVVDDVDDALRPAAMQRGDAGARQVVGVDVAGVDVVDGGEHRRAAHDALARIAAGAIERVDARDAQHRRDGTAARPKRRSRSSASARRRARSVAGRAARSRRSARRRDRRRRPRRPVDDAPQARRARQRVRARWRGAGVARPRGGGRRQVQHGIGEPCETGERRRVVEVGDERARAGSAQRVDARRRSTSTRATRQRRASRPATRRPMSPQPTISSTGLLKRIGRSGTAEGVGAGRRAAFGRPARQRAESGRV